MELRYETSENTTVYKIDYSGVAVKPEVAFKLLKIMVGERGFDPPTPWSRTWKIKTLSALLGVA